ncbi:aspartate aminotransferase family protein [Marinivivus vitaminiproducens]|uniref:aspartate aminotransferase family protein n=1 Tax=Marinivivus vitaminiproducens TaxID=3035935 RepID=UPI00279D0D7A|nr:aspartate aminotransferase family protein [Geminicoccaceae bacterium SCSIO 64248]
MTTMLTTKRLQELDGRHHLHPFTTYKDLASKGSRIIARAEGVYLHDSEGNRILDGMAGLWCVQVGYGRQELIEAGQRQLETLAYYNTFFQCSHPPAIELSAKLAEITPEGMDRIFFTNSGSEANDTVVKIVRYYWNLMGRPSKKIMIGRHYGYHGVTLAAASLSGLAPMHPQADLPLAGFVHIDAPYVFEHGKGQDPDAFGLEAARALERKILELGPDNVGAFIGEPIQGAGGVIIPPRSYWPEIQRICAKYDVLLVADEVICGFGRTGNWWGSETFAFRPDIMSMAKGLSSGYQPIAAVALGRRVGDVLFDADQEFVHGFTYSGHPVACAVALANIDVMEREGLATRAAGALGAAFAERLGSLADHPMVGEVRTEGLIGAVELVADKATGDRHPAGTEAGTRCRDACVAHGLVMRAVRDVMVVSPPLVITPDQIDELVVKARAALDDVYADLAGSR